MKKLILAILVFSSIFSFGQTVKHNNNNITFTKNVITAKYVAQDSCKIVNRVYVGTKGHYLTLKEACDVSYTAPTEILFIDSAGS
jgi:hypothetical protein